MQKIIVNESGGFKIKLDDGRFVGNGKVFPTESKLTTVNPVIVTAFNKKHDTIDFKPPGIVSEFETNRDIKFRECHAKRDNSFDFDAVASENSQAEFITHFHDWSKKIHQCKNAKNQDDLDAVITE